ncbi:MAG: hypothetical protein M3161_02585, partial [Actinomycetota bacterium]|nr:hypothetical protein [Actinomycetota bacterium]
MGAALLVGGALYVLADDGVPIGTLGRDPAAPSQRWVRAACDLPPKILERIARGLVTGRSADVHMVPRYPNFFGSFRVTTHSGPWDYLQRVPLVFYGPGYVAETG